MNDLGGKTIDPSEAPSSEEKTLALVAHILGPFTCFIGPLIIFLVKKDESDFIRQNALQSVYWQIAMFVAVIVLAVVTICVGGIGAGLGTIANIVYVIVACIRANEGKIYSYPLSGGFVK